MDKKEKGTGMSFWLQLQKENKIKKLEKYRSILEITGALSFLVILLNIGHIILAGVISEVSPAFSPKTTLIAVIFSVLIGICMILYVFVEYNLWGLKGRNRII